MAGAGGRLSPPPVKHNDRGRRGVNAQGEKERRAGEEADEHWGEIKDGEFKKLENKEGINETHQHDRAITAGMKVSKILEISHLIVFNPFSGHAGVSPSSHYRPYCANEPIRRSLVLTSSFLVLLYIYLSQTWVTQCNTNLGRTISRCRWMQTRVQQEYI